MDRGADRRADREAGAEGRGGQRVARHDQLPRGRGGGGAPAADERAVRADLPARGGPAGGLPAQPGHERLAARPALRHRGAPPAVRRAGGPHAVHRAQADGTERGGAGGHGLLLCDGRHRHHQGRRRAAEPAVGAVRGARHGRGARGGQGQRGDGAALPLRAVPQQPGAPAAGARHVRQARGRRRRADAARHHRLRRRPPARRQRRLWAAHPVPPRLPRHGGRQQHARHTRARLRAPRAAGAAAAHRRLRRHHLPQHWQPLRHDAGGVPLHRAGLRRAAGRVPALVPLPRGRHGAGQHAAPGLRVRPGRDAPDRGQPADRVPRPGGQRQEIRQACRPVVRSTGSAAAAAAAAGWLSSCDHSRASMSRLASI
mmetsp:Transcript_20060/g.51374  ORF Transcript_20060/g.51374 Transcript_20060/m.51374 type:complete len:371 (+) Transcript_20060:288-1400(+)